MIETDKTAWPELGGARIAVELARRELERKMPSKDARADEREKICRWLDDWPERRKAFTSEQADALGDAAEALRDGSATQSNGEEPTR